MKDALKLLFFGIFAAVCYAVYKTNFNDAEVPRAAQHILAYAGGAFVFGGSGYYWNRYARRNNLRLGEDRLPHDEPDAQPKYEKPIFSDWE